MHTQLFESVVDKYNRDLRRQRIKKTLAWLFSSLAAVLLLMGFGALLALINNWPIAILAALIILAGFWGQHHLNTRH